VNVDPRGERTARDAAVCLVEDIHAIGRLDSVCFIR
jgi:hypothetical protein